MTSIEVSLSYPKPDWLLVSFGRGSYKYFSLKEYLKSIHHPDYLTLEKHNGTNPSKEFADVKLDENFEIAKKHLYGNLKKVAKGWWWINIPYKYTTRAEYE